MLTRDALERSGALFLPDYKYLDTNRLQDYVSTLDPGAVDELTETTRTARAEESSEGFQAGVAESGSGSLSQDETTRKRIMRVSAQHMFSRVYNILNNAEDPTNSFKAFEEDEPLNLGDVRRRDVVEITRDFSPSPLNAAIDGIMSLMGVMEQMGFVEEMNSEEAEMVRSMAMVFQGEEGKEEVTMVSRGATSVVFPARSKYVVVDQEEFRGSMSVFGKVQKLVPEGASLDLFDFLRLPRQIRNEASLKKDLLEMFSSWPKELGGPVPAESIKVPGPAIVVTPVAVYEA
jgi:hypothetical protein